MKQAFSSKLPAAARLLSFLMFLFYNRIMSLAPVISLSLFRSWDLVLIMPLDLITSKCKSYLQGLASSVSEDSKFYLWSLQVNPNTRTGLYELDDIIKHRVQNYGVFLDIYLLSYVASNSLACFLHA